MPSKVRINFEQLNGEKTSMELDYNSWTVDFVNILMLGLQLGNLKSCNSAFSTNIVE